MSPFRRSSRFGALLVSAAIAALTTAPAQAAPAAVTAVPPAEYKPAMPEKSAPAAMLLPSGARAARVALDAPSTSERMTAKAKNSAVATSAKAVLAGDKGRPLAIGFGRTVPAAQREIALDQLEWQALPDGGRAARIEIVSPDAAALRLALQLPAADPDLSIRFAGNGADAQVFGPIPANAIAEQSLSGGSYWTPTLSGSTATIEIQAAPGASTKGLVLRVPMLSHHLITGAALHRPAVAAKTLQDIGSSGSCNINVACVTPQSTAFINATKAVAEIVFTDETGGTFLCSGTLLNDTNTSFTPYFFTANHCINSATAARTINTWWFFESTTCGTNTLGNYVQQTAGASLLARSEDWDWALVRLNAPPPSGTFFSAWRAETVPSQSTVSVIHHPEGDLKKWAQGITPGYQSFSDGSSFIQAQYSQGTTEGGSSGSALITFNSSGGYYEVRGGLFGGDASCSNRSGLDIYSRLDNMLPLTRQYLTPSQNPSGTVVAVEFYNKALRHYFISTSAVEINDLDTGVHAGWERTGFRFLAYASAVNGASPVCRFYRAPAYGDSHFYSASPSECASTAAAHPVDWIYESPNVFYIQLPNTTTGACPAGTHPLWRFFNQVTTNHRYTADVTTRDDLRAQPSTWIPEGYGPNAVIMCSPDGS